MNPARPSCNLVKRQDAQAYPRRVLQFSPDLADARKMLHQLETQPDFCGLSR